LAATERLFVALDLPAGAREALAAFRDRADPAVWRPVPDEALHVTLAFLGHRPPGTAAEVAALLPGGPAPRLALGPALVLPPRRPRVLGAAVEDPEGALAGLWERVVAALEGAGLFERERRPFLPHATVGRLRTGARAPREPPGTGPEPMSFAGSAVTLYRSHLGRGGASYEAQARVTLS
jgi:2'-5' RNA ligase